VWSRHVDRDIPEDIAHLTEEARPDQGEVGVGDGRRLRGPFAPDVKRTHSVSSTGCVLFALRSWLTLRPRSEKPGP